MNQKLKNALQWGGIAFAIVLFALFVIRSCSGSVDPFERSFKIARDSSWYPIPLYGKEKNMLGFTNELLLKISEAENFRVKLYSKNYNGLMLGLDNEEYDAIISALPPGRTNQSKYLISDPIYLIGPVLVVLKGSKYHTMLDLEGESIAYRRGDNLDIDFSKYPNVLFSVYDSYAAAVQALTGNRVDAILMDAIPAYNTIQGFYADKMKIATPPLNDKGIRLVALNTPKGLRLIDSFNKGLAKMKSDGSFKKVLDSWQLVDTEAPPQTE